MHLPRFGIPDWHVLTLAGEVPDTVWAALVAAAVTLGFASLVLPHRDGHDVDPFRARDGDESCDFLVDGGCVQPLTPPARGMLAGIAGRGGAHLQALAQHLARDCAAIEDDLEALVRSGEAFRRHCARPDGSSYEVAGYPRGAAVLLSIRPASREAGALDAAERALARACADLAFQREALDRAPLLAWALGPDGAVRWANAGYRDRFAPAGADGPESRPPAVFAHVLEEVPLTGRDGCESRRRVKLPDPRDRTARWYEVCQSTLASGETLCYAVAADDLVAAEASLRRFVETLTETFAHLPIGLAVFDKNRRLGLFNPALADLVKIDTVWLASRPSLRDFLERLRETRQLPEQKDYATFRRLLADLEEGARAGTYEENWQLPSGKIFRVTGRPHPQGALAILLEDISPTIQLERRYRAELELSQATLDRIAEAVAVFDTSGMLVFVNAAFERLWRLDPMESLEGPSIGEMIEIWSAGCAPSPAWAELAAFATGAETRTTWTAAIATRQGEAIELQVAPLPNGSTLVTFRSGSSCPSSDAAQGARRLDSPELPASVIARHREAALAGGRAAAELEARAEDALRSLAPAIGAAPDPAAFAALAAAAHGLKDGLARSRALREEAEAVLAAKEALGGTPHRATNAPVRHLHQFDTLPEMAAGLPAASPAGKRDREARRSSA